MLRAWHGDETLKAKTVAEMRRHRDHDDLKQGLYWDGHRGCAVGCLLKDPDGGHRTYEERFGIPEGLARLEDAIFENLDEPDYREWPVRFLDAIPVGADLATVCDRLILWLLRGSGMLASENPAVDAYVARVATLYERRVCGDEPAKPEWDAARDEYLSCATAANEAAWVGSQSSHRNAGFILGYSVEAERLRGDGEASILYARIADKLVELLRSAPILAGSVTA